MKKLTSIAPGRLEEIAVIAFFILFFILTIVAESSAQVKGNTAQENNAPKHERTIKSKIVRS